MYSTFWLDIVLVLLLGLGLVTGYMQGLLRQVFSLAALYVGAILATQYYLVLGKALKGLLLTTPGVLLNAVAFFAIMIAVMVILGFLAMDAAKMTLRLPPTLDHLGGMILGLVSTWIFITILINILSFATNVASWADIEKARQILSNGIHTSVIAHQTALTLPTIISAIKPWLPAGIPGIFSFS